MEHGLVAVFDVGIDAADGLAGGDAIADLDVDAAEVTVDGEVAAVADDDVVVVARQDEDARNGTRVDGSRIGALRGSDVDAIVGGADVRPAFVAVAAKALDHLITAVEREGQAATVGGKVVRELAVLTRGGVRFATVLTGRLLSVFGARGGSHLLGGQLLDATVEGLGLLLLAGQVAGEIRLTRL